MSKSASAPWSALCRRGTATDDPFARSICVIPTRRSRGLVGRGEKRSAYPVKLAKKLSAMAASKQSPAGPVEVTTIISRHRLAKASEVYLTHISCSNVTNCYINVILQILNYRKRFGSV